MSDELCHPVLMTGLSTLIIGTVGAINSGDEAKQDFLLKHQHTKWRTRLRAVVSRII